MKKRVAKKIAKKFMNDKSYTPYGICEQEYDSSDIIKTVAIFPCKVIKEIERLAEKSGWTGMHWDHPCLLSIDDSELRGYTDKSKVVRC